MRGRFFLMVVELTTRVLMRGRFFLMVVELTTRVLMRGRTFPLGKLKLHSASR